MLIFGLLALLALLAGGWGPLSWAESSLEQRYIHTQEQRQALQKRVAEIEREIERTLGQRNDAREALRSTEQAISQRARRLEQLGNELVDSEQQLQLLQQQQQTQQVLKEQMQQRLAEQLRAQYASGLSPWVALLAAKDPQEIQRELRYLGYVTQAQTQEVEALNQVLAQVQQLQQQAGQEQARIEKLRAETENEQSALAADFAAHEKLVAQLETQLSTQRGQAEQYEADSRRLQGLIQGLETELTAQREAERKAAQAAAEAQAKAEMQAAAKAAAEAAAEAEAVARAKQAAEQAARQRAAAEAETARQVAAAEAARRRLAEQLSAGGSLLESQNQSMQELEARLEARLEAEQQAAAVKRQTQEAAARVADSNRLSSDSQPTSSEPTSSEPTSSKPTSSKPNEPIALNGLNKGALMPVQGQVQGRFGMERPEGGRWRGVVIRAPEGSPVRAVAAGLVVYAGWLSGFGNLLILDHGAGFLTVYGYNQSLLKQVGERVPAGETVALIGATGGQVEAGLYFEVRQQGQPVNPQQWISGL